jgi:hypothetical protein
MLRRAAEKTLQVEDDVVGALAPLLQLKHQLCSRENRQYWECAVGKQGRRDLWSSKPVGDLAGLAISSEDVLEMVSVVRASVQSTTCLYDQYRASLENVDTDP